MVKRRDEVVQVTHGKKTVINMRELNEEVEKVQKEQ